MTSGDDRGRRRQLRQSLAPDMRRPVVHNCVCHAVWLAFLCLTPRASNYMVIFHVIITDDRANHIRGRILTDSMFLFGYFKRSLSKCFSHSHLLFALLIRYTTSRIPPVVGHTHTRTHAHRGMGRPRNKSSVRKTQTVSCGDKQML